jgi:hypothetical protein
MTRRARAANPELSPAPCQTSPGRPTAPPSPAGRTAGSGSARSRAPRCTSSPSAPTRTGSRSTNAPPHHLSRPRNKGSTGATRPRTRARRARRTLLRGDGRSLATATTDRARLTISSVGWDVDTGSVPGRVGVVEAGTGTPAANGFAGARVDEGEEVAAAELRRDPLGRLSGSCRYGRIWAGPGRARRAD